MSFPSVDRLARAQDTLLVANDLDTAKLQDGLSSLWARGGDYGDLYLEMTTRDTWSLERGKVTRAAFAISQGIGARIVTGDKTAFAYSSDISGKAIDAVTAAARAMQSHGQDAAESGRGVRIEAIGQDAQAYGIMHAAGGMDTIEKVAILRTLDDLARAVDPRITEVNAQLAVEDSTILVGATDGTLAGDIRPQIRISLSVVAESNAKRASGSAGGGGRFMLAEFGSDRLQKLVEKATSVALTNLEAIPSPAGEMTVVLGNGFPGVLLHEAVGHGLEGDFHRRQESVFNGMIGQRIAAPGVTVVDDATVPGARGSLNIDDEGVAGQRTVLIEDGYLVGLMQDKISARIMNDKMTGNGRRQSYADLPMTRMTNTFLESGPYDPAEIIASVKNGIYAVEFSGGTVDITSGQFNFSAEKAFLIEDGKVTAPIEGATLIGVGNEALKHISMIGNDLELGIGFCGKNGQTVPVSVGQPTIRMDHVVVGGAGA
ncbi:metalloprotease TldD [Novosphingobium taihuense]|uniref:TldD protein n=1 Tax=Novosphingobium taihuense TaxID=260085 RepID=A0A7W7A822_9SPHN|nr:metalloprotease TldD [Novosphingobium taihuense]MBB4611917.1 TldD protein [Novosphingobium taihuense]TWH88729.1 TldD protein [Novosphingobium taihuense]